jgi:hypothetical protein
MDTIGHSEASGAGAGESCLTQEDKDRVSYRTEGVPIGKNWQERRRHTP